MALFKKRAMKKELDTQAEYDEYMKSARDRAEFKKSPTYADWKNMNWADKQLARAKRKM